MVCDFIKTFRKIFKVTVLILVFLDYGLRPYDKAKARKKVQES